MRGLWIKACVIVLVASAAAIGQSNFGHFAGGQVSFDFTGGGARAAGMGKAFLGVSDDANAVSWNPAGLMAFEKPVLSISYKNFQPRGNFNSTGVGKESGLVRSAQSWRGTANQEGSIDRVNSLVFLAPVRIRGHQFIFSGAYTEMFDDYSTVSFGFNSTAPELNPITLEPLQTSYPYSLTGDVESRFSPHAVNLGFGTRLYRNVDFGVALNAYTGPLTSRSTFVYDVPNLLYNAQRVNYTSAIQILDTFSFSGINFTVGLKGTTPRLTYGFVVRSGFTMTATGGYTLSDTVSINGTAMAQLSRTDFLDYQLIKYTIPWTIGGGVGYKATPNLLLALDMEYRPFKNKTIQNRDSLIMHSGTSDKEFFTQVGAEQYNVFTVRAGMEYMWKTGNRLFPQVPLRAGFGYVPTPVASNSVVNDTVITTSRATEYNLSAGFGVYWSQIHIDLAYTYRSLTAASLQCSPRLPPPRMKTRPACCCFPFMRIPGYRTERPGVGSIA